MERIDGIDTERSTRLSLLDECQQRGREKDREIASLRAQLAEAQKRIRRVEELERENAELKAKWRKEECAHCGERPGGHEGTIWCAECVEWYRAEYRKADIANDSDAVRAEVAGLKAERDQYRLSAARAQEALRHVMNGLPTYDAVSAAYQGCESAQQWLEAYKRRVQAEVLEEFAEDWWHEYDDGAEYMSMLNRPWECTDGLRDQRGCFKCDALNRAAALRGAE